MTDQADSLRKALESPPASPRLRIVAVTSGKGGVGKTLVSANLALLSAKAGKRALVIDADLALANVEILYGLKPRYDIRHLLSQEVNLEEVLAQGPHGVRVLSAGTGIDALADLDDTQKLALVSSLDAIEDRFDVIFVDTGAGVGDNVRFFAGAAQETVLVITPEPTSLTDAYTALKVLSVQGGVENFHVVVNQCTGERQARETFDRLAGVAQRFLTAHVGYLGHVPSDERVPRALMARKPLVDLFPTSASACALEVIHTRLLGSPARPSNNGGLKFLWNRLMRESGTLVV